MTRRVLTALPVYNEAAHINGVLDEVRAHACDVLVVDDGSTDKTPELLSTRTDVTVLSHEQNMGYGAALRTAFDFACEQDYEVLVTIDCDGQHEPRLIPEMADAVFPPSGKTVDIVSGSRYLKSFPGDSAPPADRRRINVEITRILNERLGTKLTDAFCGFKAYRVSSLKRLDITEKGYAMPLELWVQAVALDFVIVEFPVPLVYLDLHRSFGGSLDDANRRMAYYLDVIERQMARLSLPFSAR